MKTLPTVENDFKALNDIATAPIGSRLLMAGIELGIFDVMDVFRSSKDIAATVGAHAGNTELFLNALATIDLVEKKEGLYRNRTETNTYLMKNSPTYLGPLFKTLQRMYLDPLKNLTDLVKCGPRTEACDKDLASETLWAEVTKATAGWVTGGTGQKMAAIITGLPGFSGFRKMLDLGGGHGMFALYFVAAHPIMTGVVFDRPAVVAVAKRFIQEYGMQNRVSVQAGDYLSDDIGNGYDLVWACATLNFARHDLDPLIGKIYTSLNPGGVFISFQDGMTHEQTRPDTILGHLGDAMRAGRDLYFNQGEIADSMLRCGFRSVRSQTIETAMGELDMDITLK